MESPIVLTMAAVVSAALAWAITGWWYRRQVGPWKRRAHKVEAKLDAASQQVAQARQKIEKLQRDLSEARRAAAVATSHLGSQRSRTPGANAACAAASPAPATERPAATPGFADTVPM